jgi:hypothetical protein
MSIGSSNFEKVVGLRALFLILLTVSLALAGSPKEAFDSSSDSVGSEIIDRYVTNTAAQQESLRGVQMDVQIDATLPKLKKTGKLEALRSISKVGQVTYQGLKFIGDNTIKKDVIVRYLTAERESRDVNAMAITPKNYKFKYKGVASRNNQLVHVFQVSPRKKIIGLFKGEIWVDPATYLPVRESGRFVKNPSIFLKKVEFVRDYEIRDGIAVPRQIESTVDTRFWGQAQMIISFSNFSRIEEEHANLGSEHIVN